MITSNGVVCCASEVEFFQLYRNVIIIVTNPREMWSAAGQVTIMGDFKHTLSVLQAMFGV